MYDSHAILRIRQIAHDTSDLHVSNGYTYRRITRSTFFCKNLAVASIYLQCLILFEAIRALAIVFTASDLVSPPPTVKRWHRWRYTSPWEPCTRSLFFIQICSLSRSPVYLPDRVTDSKVNRSWAVWWNSTRIWASRTRYDSSGGMSSHLQIRRMRWLVSELGHRRERLGERKKAGRG